jgi:micrococcal nuclease
MMFVALALFPLLLSASDELPTFTVPDFTGWPSYLVVQVVDGDTVKIDYGGQEFSIKLIGVATPEMVKPQEPVQYFGKEAFAFTTSYLLNQKVYLEPDQDEYPIDQYGRILAHVWRVSDSTLVSLEIIRQGFGYYDSQFPFRAEYMIAFKDSEQQARDSHTGLWAEQKSISISLTPAQVADLQASIDVNQMVAAEPIPEETGTESAAEEDTAIEEPFVTVKWSQEGSTENGYEYFIQLGFRAPMGTPAQDFKIRFFDSDGTYVGAKLGAVSFKLTPNPGYESYISTTNKISSYEIEWNPDE